MSGSILTRVNSIDSEMLRISEQVDLEFAHHAGVQSRIESAHRATFSLLPQITEWWKLVERLSLDYKAYSFRVNHLERVTNQYSALSSCFGSAADKLYNDVCQYNEESKGISHLTSSLYRYVGYAAISHLETDLAGHALWVTPSAYNDGRGNVSGSRTGIVPIDTKEVAFPVRPTNENADPYNEDNPQAPGIKDVITFSGSGQVKLRVAYSNTGDVYLQYPIGADLSQSVGVTRFESAAAVSDWYNLVGLPVNEVDQVRMGFYKNQLNPETGPYYLVFRIGPRNGVNPGKCVLRLKAGGLSGTWAWESNPFEVTDDSASPDTYAVNGQYLTVNWTVNTNDLDGVAIRLPIPQSATADIAELPAGSDGIVPFWGNVIEVSIEPLENVYSWRVFTLADVV